MLFRSTLLGSVLMLLAIMALYWNAGTTDIPTLMHTDVPRSLQTWAWLAFFASFAVSLVLLWRFDASTAEFQFVEKARWLSGFANYHMGVDGISLPFVILTTALMPLCIIASWKSITVRVGEYMMAFLLLETLMVGTFSALD